MALGSQPNGIAGTLHCNTRKEGPATVYVAERLSNQAKEDDLQPAGCFVVTSHFSLPTVRKAMGDTLEKFRFVLVYTTSDGRLTSVPVMGSDLCADESYYGEQSIDELRQWTKKS